MRSRATTAITIVVTLALTFAGGQVSASESEKALQILEKVTPALLADTRVNNTLSLSPGKRTDGLGAIRLKSEGAARGQSVALTIDYVNTQTLTKSGLVVMAGNDQTVEAVAQETGNGFRVLTTISAKPATRRFDYTFDVPQSTRLVETGGGYMLTDGKHVLGILGKPWAVDATGKQLRTHYEWNKSVLTQVLDEDLLGVSYPLVLDPAWGYVFQYDLSFSAATNMSRLRTCFNCYFPVTGAPRAYPRLGQLLPLTVGIFNFECRMGSTIESPSYASFQFDATKNHIDGYGSDIIFQFIRVGSSNYMLVDAYITNSLDFIRGPYIASAGLNWQLFAWNLNSTKPKA